MSSRPENAQMIENYEENVKKPQSGTGTAFKPSYSMSLTDVSTQAKAYALRDSIKLYAGATLPDPGASSVVTPASSRARGYGVRMARIAATEIRARQLIQCAVFVLRVGICLV